MFSQNQFSTPQKPAVVEEVEMDSVEYEQEPPVRARKRRSRAEPPRKRRMARDSFESEGRYRYEEVDPEIERHVGRYKELEQYTARQKYKKRSHKRRANKLQTELKQARVDFDSLNTYFHRYRQMSQQTGRRQGIRM